MSDGSDIQGASERRPTKNFSRGDVGALPWLYAFLGVGTGIIFLGLLAMNALLIFLGFGNQGLGAQSDPAGIAGIAALAIVITFIGVLWPVGFLSQMLLYFVLFSRAFLASKSEPLATFSSVANMGPTVDVVVQSRYSARLNLVGDLGWLPNWRLMLGGYGIALAITVGSDYSTLRRDGIDAMAILAVMALCCVVGMIFIATGVRARLVKLRAGVEAQKHRVELDKRAARRQELRRAKLTPEEREAEDLKSSEAISRLLRYPRDL